MAPLQHTVSARRFANGPLSCPDTLAEAALAHVIADQTQAAYQRGDLLEKRKRMMESWVMFFSQTEAVENSLGRPPSFIVNEQDPVAH